MPGHWNSAQLNNLRLAVAITASVLIAFIIGWPGSFIMPVFVCVILSAGGPAIPINKGLILLLMVAILLWIGQFLTEVFLPHPVVCMLLIVWMLLIGQYAAIRGGNMMLVVILFIAILILPLMGMDSLELVDEFASGLFLSIAMAILMCWIAHGLIFDPRLVANAKPEQPVPPKQECYRQAAIKTILVLPLLLIFYLLQLTSDLLVLVFVALLIQMPSAEIGIKGAVGTLAANGVGGLAAVICYQLLVVVPSPVMLGLLVFICSLMFGQKIYSDSPTASLYGTGLNTVIVLLGATTGSFGDEAGDKMWVRLAQIGAACVYIVAALSLAENWLKRSSPRNNILKRMQQ